MIYFTRVIIIVITRVLDNNYAGNSISVGSLIYGNILILFRYDSTSECLLLETTATI